MTLIIKSLTRYETHKLVFLIHNNFAYVYCLKKLFWLTLNFPLQRIFGQTRLKKCEKVDFHGKYSSSLGTDQTFNYFHFPKLSFTGLRAFNFPVVKATVIFIPASRSATSAQDKNRKVFIPKKITLSNSFWQFCRALTNFPSINPVIIIRNIICVAAIFAVLLFPKAFWDYMACIFDGKKLNSVLNLGNTTPNMKNCFYR